MCIRDRYKDQYVRELLHGNNFNDDNKDEEKSDGMCAGKVFSKVSRWIFGLVGFWTFQHQLEVSLKQLETASNRAVQSVLYFWGHQVSYCSSFSCHVTHDCKIRLQQLRLEMTIVKDVWQLCKAKRGSMWFPINFGVQCFLQWPDVVWCKICLLYTSRCV